MPDHRLRRAAGALLFVVAAGAQAQYAWIGPNGTRQYSDRPPPPGTPASRILKAPGRALLAPPAAEPRSEPGPRADAKAAPTLAERESAYRERAKARTEHERKEAEQANRQRALDERCAGARQGQAQLASGTRIAQYGADGERRYLSDQERALRVESVNRVLQDCR